MRNTQRNVIFFIVLLASLFLSACAGLLNEAEKAVGGGEYRPTYSAQEHQMRTFEALWSDLKNAYVYYDTADVDWDALHKSYTGRIQAGLTEKEFSAMLDELET